MKTPVIDPSQLTEEQQQRIKVQHSYQWQEIFAAIRADDDDAKIAARMAIDTLEWLFGKEFFIEYE